MSKISQFFIVLCFCLIELDSKIESIEKFPKPLNLKTSVIIPCHYSHFFLLYDVLESYQNQTVYPDEVVISLSEVNKIPNQAIQDLQNRDYPFQVTILTTNKKNYAGVNRNIACSKAQGEILTLQDADDLAHPQRVEILKYLFENFDLDVITHEIFFDSNEIPMFTLDELSGVRTYDCDSFFEIAWPIGSCITCFKNSVFKQVQWTNKKTGEDVEFLTTVIKRSFQHFYLKTKLYIYRNELSSWNRTYQNQTYPFKTSETTLDLVYQYFLRSNQ